MLELSVGEKGLVYNYGSEWRTFIEQTEEMIELGLSAKLGDKILNAWEEAKKMHK